MSQRNSTLPIIIIGAGIGGLVLAHGLSKHSIPYRIFERDSRANARSQGYRFRAQPEGIDALRELVDYSSLELLEQFTPILEGGQRPLFFWDPVAGQQVQPFVEAPPKKPSAGSTLDRLAVADRRVMRDVLLQGINVEFGKSMVSYEIHADSQSVTVGFADGGEVQGSMIVGADGSTSKVRSQMMPEYRLLQTPGRWFWGKTLLTEDKIRRMASQAPNGFHMLRDTTSGKNPQTLIMEFTKFRPDPSFITKYPGDINGLQDYVAFTLMSSTEDIGISDEELQNLNAHARVQLMKDITAKWAPEWKILIDEQEVESSAAYKVVSSTPKIPKWGGHGLVTLIGDAAHCMVATAAAGASTAMRDGQVLVEAVERNKGDLSKAISSYEEQMRVYAEAVIRTSDQRNQAMFGMPSLDAMAAEQLK